jgi:hypothetical protein
MIRNLRERAQPRRKVQVDRISPGRAFCTSFSIALAAVALLGASRPAFASVRSTTHYKYRIIGFDYKASGALGGGRVAECVGVASWEGAITTEAKSDPLSTALDIVTLTITSHGTHGGGDFLDGVVAKSFYSAEHRVTTACAGDVPSETAFTKTPCTQTVDSELAMVLSIRGGVGNRVTLDWTFAQVNGASGALVPNFTCMEPFSFPELPSKGGRCTTNASLSAFNKRFVTLPFVCLYETKIPPAGVAGYYASADAKGTLRLKRRK